MNKISIAACVAFIAICSFSSCKKVFNCSCVTTTSINDTVTSINTLKREYRTTKGDAKSKCTSWSQTNVMGKNITKSSTDCKFE